MTQQTTARVRVNGDKLAQALRRVSPFMADKTHPNIAGVYAESQGGTLQLTTTDGLMIAGPDKKIAYHGERLRRALTSCGPSATIEVGDPTKPTLFESEDYWHILAPLSVFPREVSLTNGERESLKWAEEALQAIRKGEVAGRVLMGGGKFYLELLPGDAQTEIRVQEPRLVKPAPEPPSAEAAVDESETTE